jgi:hypothetical protein
MAAGREESSKQTISLEEESKGERRRWEGNWKLKSIDLLREEGGRNWKEND